MRFVHTKDVTSRPADYFTMLSPVTILFRPKTVVALAMLVALISSRALHWQEHAHAGDHADTQGAASHQHHDAGRCHHHGHQHAENHTSEDGRSPHEPHHHDHDCEICFVLAHAAPLTQVAVISEGQERSREAILPQSEWADSLDAPVLPGRGPPRSVSRQEIDCSC